mmetsp:Transcript_113194/g.365730  ORF Transcript_113194/g.365730 Transcript_113194/m.365730 type:complete len:277 (-) Transcript_113194:59-889(-)
MASADQALYSTQQPGYGAPLQEAMEDGGAPRTLTPALQSLEGVQHVEIQEKVSYIEAISALLGQEIEMPNAYRVFADGKDREIFYAVEQTNCLTRQMKQCCNDCAPWELHIIYTEGGQQEVAFRIERPFTCTCCCFNRPTITMYDAVSQEKMGSVVDPFSCCALDFNMRDGLDNPVLDARGGCCQPGLWCPLPCGPCAKVHFPVYDPKQDVSVGKVTKKVPGCLKWIFADDVDNYKVDFGAVADPRWKAMLIALTIFIDFRYFSDNSMDDKKDTDS